MFYFKRFPLFFVSILALFSWGQCSLLSKTFQKLQHHFKQHTLKRDVQRTLPTPWMYQRVQTKYMLQNLDHFDSQNSKQFLQRYFTTDEYWRSPDGPVFLYVGGEGQLVPEVLMGGEVVNLAAKFGALLLAIEHRYYGLSVPDEGLKLKNMIFLSSQQALADISVFHKIMSRTYNLTERNRWIAFGGSYPGSLSAWLRSKFPNVVFGAVASSAPVLAKENFEGYNEVVAASLSSSLVGGSKKCVDAVSEAFTSITDMLKKRDFLKLQEDFASCNNISSPNATKLFMQNLAGIFMGVVQYNNEEEGVNIRKVCKYMTDETKHPYDRLRDVNKGYLEMVHESCNDNSYRNYLMKLKEDTVDPTGYSQIRQWYYQTCSEFGFYQTCDPGTSCVFSHSLNLQEYVEVCQEVFELPMPSVAKRVAFTNDYYGGRRPAGSRIVFVNGSIDPWHRLGVLSNTTSADETSIFIPGTAHCKNMQASSPRDPAALTRVREEIRQLVGKWLNIQHQ